MNIHLDGLLTITALVRADADQCRATDVYQLAHDMRLQFPRLIESELISIVESAVVAVRGAAVWERHHDASGSA